MGVRQSVQVIDPELHVAPDLVRGRAFLRVWVRGCARSSVVVDVPTDVHREAHRSEHPETASGRGERRRLPSASSHQRSSSVPERIAHAHHSGQLDLLATMEAGGVSVSNDPRFVHECFLLPGTKGSRSQPSIRSQARLAPSSARSFRPKLAAAERIRGSVTA
jgi:hypothetical protein